MVKTGWGRASPRADWCGCTLSIYSLSLFLSISLIRIPPAPNGLVVLYLSILYLSIPLYLSNSHTLYSHWFECTLSIYPFSTSSFLFLSISLIRTPPAPTGLGVLYLSILFLSLPLYLSNPYTPCFHWFGCTLPIYPLSLSLFLCISLIRTPPAPTGLSVLYSSIYPFSTSSSLYLCISL